MTADAAVDLARWCRSVIPRLASALDDDPFWPRVLRDATRGIHLAVFQEPYLTYMLDGTKTVESRFATRRFAPYGLAAPGDWILIKQTSGPVVGIAHVVKARSYELDAAKLRTIRAEFGAAIRAEIAGFWDERREARYATLLEIDEPRTLATPITCPKRDRRGWIVLRPSTR